MNRIYKLKLNKKNNQLTVVSELANNAVAQTDAKDSVSFNQACTTNSTNFFRSFLTNSLLVTSLIGSFGASALASTDITGTHGQLGSVVTGTATSVTEGLVTTIKNSPNAIINWKSFNINQNELLKFVQNSASSVVLNRVVGGDVSKILGSLESNGQVFVINPNGIIFGKNSHVNVGGLVASTLDINNKDFLNGRYVFNKDKDHEIAQVLNSGVIKVNADGSLALIGGQVLNNGVLEARNGTIFLLAGQSIEIADLNNPQVSYKVTAQNQAVNLGHVFGKNAVLLGNKVLNGPAGTYHSSFADVIGATDVNVNQASIDADGQVVLFGGSEANSLQSTSQANTQVVGTRNSSVVNNAEINVSNASGKAGNVKVLGDTVILASNSNIQATGDQGGTVTIGGDATGKVTVKLAKTAYLDQNQLINISATQDAGHAVVWSDHSKVDGKFEATSVNGQGGFIETSGHSIYFGKKLSVNTASVNGETGTWLIDPEYFAVVGSADDLNKIKGKEIADSGVSFSNGDATYDSSTSGTFNNDNSPTISYITQDQLTSNNNYNLTASKALYIYNVTKENNFNSELTLSDTGSASEPSVTAIINSKFGLSSYHRNGVKYGDDKLGYQLYVLNSTVPITSLTNKAAKIYFKDSNIQFNSYSYFNIPDLGSAEIIIKNITIYSTIKYYTFKTNGNITVDQLQFKNPDNYSTERLNFTVYSALNNVSLTNVNYTGISVFTAAAKNNVTIKTSKIENRGEINITAIEGTVDIDASNITNSNSSVAINITAKDALIINNSNIGNPRNGEVNLKNLGAKPLTISDSLISVNGTIDIDSQSEVTINKKTKLVAQYGKPQYDRHNIKNNGSVVIKTTKTLTVDDASITSANITDICTTDIINVANSNFTSSTLNVTSIKKVSILNTTINTTLTTDINGNGGVSITNSTLDLNHNSSNITGKNDVVITNTTFNTNGLVNITTVDNGNITLKDQKESNAKINVTAANSLTLDNSTFKPTVSDPSNFTAGNGDLNIVNKTIIETRGEVNLKSMNGNITVNDSLVNPLVASMINVEAKKDITLSNNTNLSGDSVKIDAKGNVEATDTILNASHSSIEVTAGKELKLHNTSAKTIATSSGGQQHISLVGETGITIDQGGNYESEKDLKVLSNGTISILGEENKPVSLVSHNGTVDIATDVVHILDSTAGTTGNTVNLQHVCASGKGVNVLSSDKVTADNFKAKSSNEDINITAANIDVNHTDISSYGNTIFNATAADNGSVSTNNTNFSATKGDTNIVAQKNTNLINTNFSGDGNANISSTTGDVNTQSVKFDNTGDANVVAQGSTNLYSTTFQADKFNIEAKTGNITLADHTDLKSSKDLALKSNANITLINSVLDAAGNVSLSAKHSVSLNDGANVTAKGTNGIALTSTEKGIIEVNNSNLSATQTTDQGVKIDTTFGDVNFDHARVETANDIKINTKSGNAKIVGSTLTPTGDKAVIEINADKIDMEDTIGESKDSITLTSTKDDLNVVGSNLSAGCSVFLNSNKNLVVVNSNITGGCKLGLASSDGDSIVKHSIVKTTDDTLEIKAKHNIGVTDGSKIQSKGKLSILPQDGVYNIVASTLESDEKEIILSAANGKNSIIDSSAITQGCQVVLPDDLGNVIIKRSKINTCRDLPLETPDSPDIGILPKDIPGADIPVSDDSFVVYIRYNTNKHRIISSTQEYAVAADAGRQTKVNYITNSANLPDDAIYTTETCSVYVPKILHRYGIPLTALIQEGLQAKYRVSGEDFNNLKECKVYRPYHTKKQHQGYVYSTKVRKFEFLPITRYENNILNNRR